MARIASDKETGLEPLDGRQIRNRIRAIISGSIDRTTPDQFNLIGSLLHRALDPELDPDLTKPVFLLISNEQIGIKFDLMMGGDYMWQTSKIYPDDHDYFVCRPVVQVRGVFLKLAFEIDFIVALRASMREVAAIVKQERIKSSGLSSKWSEENRTAQQVKVRLEPELLAKVEMQAVKDGMSRNAWISKALTAALPKP